MASIIFRATYPIFRLGPVSARCCVQFVTPTKLQQTATERYALAEASVKAMLNKYATTSKVNEAPRILTSLKTLVVNKEINLDELLNNPKFHSMLDDLGKQSAVLSHTYLLTCMKNLLELKVPSDSYVMKAMNMEVLWRARKMPIQNLLYFLSFHQSYQEIEGHQQLQKEVQAILERRWVEIVNVSDVCALLALQHIFSPEFLLKLDDQMIGIIEDASALELVKLLTMLSSMKRRATPALRSLAHHLSKKEKLEMKLLTKVLHGMNILSFPNEMLLKYVATCMAPEISAIERSNQVTHILVSMGQLKWKNMELLQECTEWIMKHFDECRIHDLVAYIVTCGCLNYLHDNSSQLFSQLMRKVTKDSVENPAIWLDVVWSLAVLQKATPLQISSVFTPNFLPKESSVIQKAKFNTLNTLAKIETPKYRGSLLPSDYPHTAVPCSQDTQKLKENVISALSNFVPQEKFLKLNSLTHGILIDAEFIMDSNFKPVPVDYETISVNDKKMFRPLPARAHRIALMVWSYKDLILNVEDVSIAEPTGATAVTKRILETLGYVVVEIPHFEFPHKDTVLKKVQYLQQKLGAAIQNNTDKRRENKVTKQ